MADISVIGQEVKKFIFTTDVIKKFLGDLDDITAEFAQGLSDNFLDVISRNEENEFYKDNKQILDDNALKIDALIKTETREYREYLNKFFLSDNLNFLVGNGCSFYAGAKIINEQMAEELQNELLNFDGNSFDAKLKKKIKEFKDLRIEEVLDKLNSLYLYWSEIEKDNTQADLLLSKINSLKQIFLEKCVFSIDYANNIFHQAFLKKLVSRPAKLNPVNIFTINYDLLFERTSEDMEIVVNNGFVGFHNRMFMPSSFRLKFHLKEANINRQFSRVINIYKLHGSISWEKSEEGANNAYGLIERQFDPKQEKKSDIARNCIIYPLQYKKKNSLDLPYSELFRQFIENMHRPDSVLVVVGYSFLDDHINDLILNALLKPDFNLVVFSYFTENELNGKHAFLKSLINRSKSDPRISIFSGKNLASFENAVRYLMPFVEENNFETIIKDTVKIIKEGVKSNG